MRLQRLQTYFGFDLGFSFSFDFGLDFGMRIKRVIRRAWAERLRSGQHEQGTGYLTQVIGGKEYDCCLGVLCKMAIEAGVKLHVEEPEGDRTFFMYGYAFGALPYIVREWAGIESANPIVKIEGAGFAALSDQNDAEVPFDKIAGLIENDQDAMWDT